MTPFGYFIFTINLGRVVLNKNIDYIFSRLGGRENMQRPATSDTLVQIQIQPPNTKKPCGSLNHRAFLFVVEAEIKVMESVLIQIP